MKTTSAWTILFGALLLAAGCVAQAADTSFDVDSGRPVVQLTVNGQGPYPFVFDTGMPGLLVARSLADELVLEVVGETRLQSPAGGTPVPADVVGVDSIALGGMATGSVEATVLDLPEIMGRGVVGPVMFRDHGPMTIDFVNNTISIGPGHPIPKITTWMPFGDSAPLLDVPVRIGEVVIDGHLDTGNADVLAVPEMYVSRLPLTGPVHTVGHARTLDAEFELRAATTDATAIVGDAEIPLRQILIHGYPVANLGTAGCRGLLLHIDWAKERFGLTGVAETGHEPLPAVRKVPAGSGRRFGVMAFPEPDGTLKVAGTEPGSAAEAIGLVAGDHIIAINGTPIQELDSTTIRAALIEANLELTVLRNGETLTVR